MSLERLVLLPAPRQRRSRRGRTLLLADGAIACDGDPAAVFPLASRLQRCVARTQHLEWRLVAGPADDDPRRMVRLRLAPQPAVPAQGYVLEIGPRGVDLVAGEAAGAFYGLTTLEQILDQADGALPHGRIEDHPDFPVRGVMLDVSRDKVPTLETLYALVDLLSSWKLNSLELYTEHTFAYRNHREVWAQASPITGEDILRLDAYCQERFVELVPNQNSFGHLHRWLERPRYRHLAECPDGFDFPWGRHDGPFSLAPTDPRSLALLAELYAELLPHFRSRRFNVGCDETFDVGQGRSRRACARRGKGRVYLDFLLKIHELVRQHGRTMHFWGDIILQHPELVGELPGDVVVLEWGYEADHPFAEHSARFAASGLPFYVCPGTSSWNTLAGRTRNCLGNLRSAATNGLRHGARGYLITDWGDAGHWQYLPVSYLGFAAGAWWSWCGAAGDEPGLVPALDRFAFRDRAGVMGRLAFDLGNAYLRTGHQPHNASPLFHSLQRPLSRPLDRRVTAARLRQTRAYIEEVAAPLAQARMDRPDGSLVAAEYANAVRLLLHGCDRGLARRQGRLGQASRRQLSADLALALGEHRSLWTARNRPGGLQDSTRNLERCLTEYQGR